MDDPDQPPGVQLPADATTSVLLLGSDATTMDRLASALTAGDTAIAVTTKAPDDPISATDVNLVTLIQESGRFDLTPLEGVPETPDSPPVVVLDADYGPDHASRALQAGSVSYLPLDDNDLDGIAAHLRTLALDHRRHRALLDREQQFERLLSNLPGMVYRCQNAEGWPMEFVSEGVEDLTGYDPAALTSGDVTYGEDIIVPEDQDHVWATVQAAVEDRDSFQIEYRIRTADGDTRWVWEQGHGVYDAGEVVALEGFITDVTDRRRARMALAERNERLDEFASVVSHDLRNPLNVAQGHLEHARVDTDTEHLQAVDRALSRMDDLIEDLLTLSRYGGTVEEPETVDLETVLTQCWGTVATDGGDLRVRDDLRIRAEESRVRRLFENLLRNAIEHGGDAVTVEVDELDDGTGFYVADDGTGVPDEVQDRIFEAGFSTHEDGTGFGLNIVRRIAEAHGWQVQVTTASRGGARFEFRGVDVV